MEKRIETTQTSTFLYTFYVFIVVVGWEEVGVSLKCEMSFKQCLSVFCVIEIDLVMKTTTDVFV